MEKLKNLTMGWQPRVSMAIGLATTLIFLTCKTQSHEIPVSNIQVSRDISQNIDNPDVILVDNKTNPESFAIAEKFTNPEPNLNAENLTSPDGDKSTNPESIQTIRGTRRDEDSRPAGGLFDKEIFERLHSQSKTKHPEEIVDRSLPPTKESLDLQFNKIVSRRGRSDLNDATAKTSEEVLNEIVNYGLDQTRYLFEVQEKQIYNKGLVIQKSDPAHFVGAFNKQTQRAKELSKYGYATLQASSLLSKQ